MTFASYIFPTRQFFAGDESVLFEEFLEGGGGGVMIDDFAGGGEVIEQAARRPVRRVDGAEEAPRFRQQLPHRRRPHLREVGAAMDAPEVSQKTVEVDLFCVRGQRAGDGRRETDR